MQNMYNNLKIITLIVLVGIYLKICGAGENGSRSKLLHDYVGNSCFCELQGQVDDCECTVDKVDSLNNFKIQPLLNSVLKNPFFRYYKVNLHKPCLFWSDGGQCVLKDCSVNVCRDDEIPIGLKGDQSIYLRDGQSKKDCMDSELDYVNETISEENRKIFETWKTHDDTLNNFCDVDNETNKDTQYVDLLLNPERYTGYKGYSAQRVWKSIYDENCFDLAQDFGFINNKILGDQCLEKRAFFRAISGLHTSISIHLCANHFIPGTNFGKGRWEYNVNGFQKRFSRETTKGEGPVWLRNLYFLYLLEIRAIAKAAPYFEDYQFYTGDKETDAETKDAIFKLLEFVRSFEYHFDESQMFQGNKKKATILREEFRQHFYNISRIMDCVGCDKCKVWGKLQVQGLGTALKILFSHSSAKVGAYSIVNAKSKQDFQLSRQEIVALFNAFGRLSNSIKELDNFKKLLNT